MISRLVSILVVASVIFAAKQAASFDSYGLGGGKTGDTVHGKITKEAAKRLKIDDCDKLQEAVRNPDWEQTSLTGLKLRPNKEYKAASHFDRGPNKSHADAFSEAGFLVRTERQKCIAFTKEGKTDAALASLGRVLHAVQDLVSHSNFVDLTDEQRSAVEAAIWNEKAATPTELKLTGFDPQSDVPGKPKNDPFSHDDFSKDNESKNDESKKRIGSKTKFEVAYKHAVDLTERIFNDLKSEVGDEGWTRLSKRFD